MNIKKWARDNILHNQILIALLIILSVYILFQIIDILMIFFFAFAIYALLKPIVAFLEKKGTPRFVAILLPYVFFLTLIILFGITFFPKMFNELKLVSQLLPYQIAQISSSLGIKADTAQLNSFLMPSSSFFTNLFAFSGKIFNVIVLVFATIVTSIYLLFYEQNFEDSLLKLFPETSHQKVKKTLQNVENQLGSWLRGQLLLSLSVGLLSGLSLVILRVNLALPLAVIAAFLEIVPSLGPILASIPAILIGFEQSGTTATMVAVSYLVIQFMENHFLVPKIMQKSVDLHPIVIIFVILIAVRFFGILGALLSLPLISSINIIVQSIREKD